jgi:ribonuclease E
MRIVATTPVQDVLAAYPDAADVLDWYGVDPEEVEGKTLTVRELCKTFDVELEEMLTDLQALADEEGESEDEDSDDEDDDDDDEDEDSDDDLDDDDDDDD